MLLLDKVHKSDLLLFCHHPKDSFDKRKHKFDCFVPDLRSQNSWYFSAGAAKLMSPFTKLPLPHTLVHAAGILFQFDKISSQKKQQQNLSLALEKQMFTASQKVLFS